MIAVSVAEVAQLLGARVVGSGDLTADVLGVVIDSRAVQAGSLFVALGGERVDGHDFVEGAFGGGAVAAITQRPVSTHTGPCLVVDDPVLALGRLARAVVDRAAVGGLSVLAITGSQGKTSTKDLLAQILEQAGPTVAPAGNLNNELGVPLTACRIDAGTRFLVSEMGARGVGHIAYLCRLTPPRVGVVLNVGHAHVGEFGSQQAIARAKGELIEAVPADGVAVLNVDDPLVWAMRDRTRAPVIAFSGLGRPAWPSAVWASGVTSDALGRHRFTVEVTDVEEAHSRAEVELGLSGRHHVVNAIAAAAAAVAVGVDLTSIAVGLSNATLRSRSRMEIHRRADDVIVINDAYNANPDSARAALDTLSQLGRARRRENAGATTWAVLGDMLELGGTAADEHVRLGRHLATVAIDRLVAVGEFAPELARGAVTGGVADDHVVVLTDKTTAAGNVVPYLQPGDTVLVKASRGLALETVAEEIWTVSAHDHQTRRGHDHPSGPVPESEDPA